VKYLLLAAVVACGGGASSKPASQPAQPTAPKRQSTYAELEARIPKIITAMDQLGADLAAVSSDCPMVAAVLRKWGSQFAVELDALWELKNQLTPEETERWQFEHDDDAKRLKPVFEAALTSCQGNTEVEDALTVSGFRRAESSR
jgi:hypothetical protein